MKSLFIISLALMFSCSNSEIISFSEEVDIYRNIEDSVSYVGMGVCKQCHYDIYNTYIQTGMGQSFSGATKSKSVINDDDSYLIYDEIKDLYYQALWKEDSLYLLEFRLEKYDTVHKILQRIDYVIGSGHHTNSHIYNINGFLHQLPFTYYTQEERSDLPPGYEDGSNTRFSRKIGLECMTCHNAYPNHEKGSLNKYKEVPSGIDCERCHGPGELHVNEKKNGISVDVINKIDYSIVNPGKLENSLQFDVCRRCHLQGTSVLQNGKDWDDFKPGTLLSETIETYLPKYENDESFIMASHVDRLQQSNCYTIGGLNCITCHDPHTNVKTLGKDYFNSKCTQCHEICEEKVENNDCILCHMPKSSTIDIPHVSITDHKISIHNDNNIEKGSFLSLECINNDSPTNLSKAKAYLKHYESFDNNILLLDSSKMFLDRCDIHESFPFYIQYYYLKKEYIKCVKFSDSINLDEYCNIFTDNVLGLTNFRIGDSYRELNLLDKSYEYFKKSLDFSPLNLEYLLKTAVIEIELSKFEISKNRLKMIINLNPNYTRAHYNLGLIYLNEFKDTINAKICFEKVKQLNPDYYLNNDIKNLINISNEK